MFSLCPQNKWVDKNHSLISWSLNFMISSFLPNNVLVTCHFLFLLSHLFCMFVSWKKTLFYWLQRNCLRTTLTCVSVLSVEKFLDVHWKMVENSG